MTKDEVTARHRVVVASVDKRLRIYQFQQAPHQPAVVNQEQNIHITPSRQPAIRLSTSSKDDHTGVFQAPSSKPIYVASSRLNTLLAATARFKYEDGGRSPTPPLQFLVDCVSSQIFNKILTMPLGDVRQP